MRKEGGREGGVQSDERVHSLNENESLQNDKQHQVQENVPVL